MTIPSKNKKLLLITAAIILALLIIGKNVAEYVLVSEAFVAKYIVRQDEKKHENYADYLSKDEIKVVLVGTAGPMSPDLAQNATAVFVNGQFLLFDAGDYAQKKMEQLNLPSASIDGVFLTHFHNDHIADLGEVMQRSFILGREKDFIVYGPTGTANIVDGFNKVYAEDSGYRTEHHSEEYMPSKYHFAKAVEFSSDISEAVIYQKNGVVVTAFPAFHPPVAPAFAYKVEYDGKKVVISGDTVVTDELEQHSKSADLLVMDTMNYELVELMENTFKGMRNERLAHIMYDIREYHPDVEDIAKLAKNNAVKRLALTHFAPAAPYDAMMKSYYLKPIKRIYDGEIFAGEDGLTVSIPLD